MMTSNGTMETFLTSVSRSLSSSTKWVGMPAFSILAIRRLVIWLLMTPLPTIGTLLCAVKGGGVVLVGNDDEVGIFGGVNLLGLAS